MQREWDSGEGRKHSVGLSVMFYSSHTHDTQYSEEIWMASSGYDNAGRRYVKTLNIAENATHFIWQLWVTKPDCRFYSNYFLNMIQKHFFNLHWSLWFDYSQLMKQIPLHHAMQSISHVMHMHIILASSLWSVIRQAPDTKHALLSPSENAAGSEKCANCGLLIHFAFFISSI